MKVKYSILLTSMLLSFNNSFCMQRMSNILKISPIAGLGTYFTRYFIEHNKFEKLCHETDKKALEDLDSKNTFEKERGKRVFYENQQIKMSYAASLNTFLPLGVVKDHKRELEDMINEEYSSKK